MKIVFSIFIFLISMSAAAQSNRYNDGSYYNDDYIHEEDMIQNTNVKSPSDTYAPTEAELPRHSVVPPKIKAKKRKPAGGFKEVHSGGRVGDFIEVGGESENQLNSRGSK